MPPPGMGQQGQGVAIDLRDYKERAAKGAITLQRLGKKQFQMIVQQFDQHSGEELDPIVVAIDPDGIDASIKQQEKVIADANNFMESLSLLKSEMNDMIANKSTVAQPKKTATASAVSDALDDGTTPG